MSTFFNTIILLGIIQGLVVAHKQNIDIMRIEDEALTEKLEALGDAK